MPKIIAHRGARGYAPENTMPAFETAIEMDADGIEIDVHMSSDNEVVVIHDATIDRTSNGKGPVNDLTLEELKRYDYGGWYGDEFKGTEILTLKELLEFLKDWDGLLNIEIKGSYDKMEAKVYDLIKQYNMMDQIIISSFNHHALYNMKQIDPSIEIGLLYSNNLFEPWVYAGHLKAEALHPSYHTVTPEVVKGCRQSNVRLNPYTINNEEDIERMVLAGVDGIITDYPDIALEVRKRT